MSEVVRQHSLFASLPPKELDHLLINLPRRTLPAGAMLFYEGDHGDRCYIVLSGEVEIIRELGTGEEAKLAIRGPGSLIGEMALLHPEGRRLASGRTSIPTEILELSRPEFAMLLQRVPQLAFETIQLMSQRLRNSHDVTTQDLGFQLAQAYNDLQQAQAQLLEREKLEQDLRLAHEIQQRMLPQVLPRLDGWFFGARMLPARHVGGDFFDFIQIDANTVGVIVADVCGKGMGAALQTALTRGLLRAELCHAASPLEALQQVNRHLIEVNDSSLFVTVGCAIVKGRERTVTSYRAGHELPIVATMGDIWAPPRGLGHPLGLIADPMIDVQQVHIPPGGRLFLYTDGITEAQNGAGDFFGELRLREIIGAISDSAPQDCCDLLIQHILDFQQSMPQSDDLTIAVLQHLV